MDIRLDQIFGRDVRFAQGDPRLDWRGLLPGEEASVAKATEKRRREFSAGRILGRRAMSELGFGAAPILAGADRAPVWPAGVAGSISHCEDWCIAAVARLADGFLSIGVDIEPALSLDDDLVGDICGEGERDWLAMQPAPNRGVLARAIFSAKECAYKCQYPLSRTLLDYHAMSVSIDLAASTFTARFEVDAGPFRAGDRLEGRISLDRDHIVTGMTLKKGMLQ